LRPPLVKNNADDFKNERLQEFINHIDKYDIISLQEMFCLANNRQQVLLSAAREKGLKYYAESVRASWYSAKFIDAGLLILSKYPILESDGYIYRSGNQIDGWAAKQVIYAKIQITGTFFFCMFLTLICKHRILIATRAIIRPMIMHGLIKFRKWLIS